MIGDGESRTQSKLALARSKYAPYDPQSERPLVLYDSSVTGRAGSGFLLTSRFLYTHPGLFGSGRKLEHGELQDKVKFGGAVTLDGETLFNLDPSGSSEIETLQRLVLDDFFAGIADGRFRFDEGRLRSFVDPERASPFVREILAHGAARIVALGLIHAPRDGEQIVARIGDFVITTHRIVRLPDDQAFRGAATGFRLSGKYSKPANIEHGPLLPKPAPPAIAVTTTQLVYFLAAHAARYAFNNIAREIHTTRLVCLTGTFQGLVSVFAKGQGREFELTWPPGERADALAFCSAVRETGIEVTNLIGE